MYLLVIHKQLMMPINIYIIQQNKKIVNSIWGYDSRYGT